VIIHSFLLGLIYAQLKIPKENIQLNILPEVRSQIERLYQQDPEERVKAARILGEIGTQASPAIPFLINILNDEHPVLSRNETKTIEYTTPAREATIALFKIGEPAVKPLALKKHEATVKKIVQIPGKIKGNDAVEALIGALNDEDMRVQCAAGESVG
jgi:HEAT repeat protein